MTVVEREVVIDGLGDQADGLARSDGQRLAVPGALPGERHLVRFALDGNPTVIATSVARFGEVERAAPPCPHFSTCGGCVSQHLMPADETAWKLGRVRHALARRGLRPPVEWAHQSPLGSRRRIRLGVERRHGAPELGYRARRSNRVVDVDRCPIADPRLVALLAPLRVLLERLDWRPSEVELTEHAGFVDLLWIGSASPTLDDREQLATFADDQDLARLGWQTRSDVVAEPILVRRTPELSWPALSVVPPLGVFVQPTVAGERALQSLVSGALAGAGRVVDLYAGIGTLAAAALDAGAKVVAVERDGDAVAAMAGRHPRLEVLRRDLDRAPLGSAELEQFDAAVLDPPRRGAEAQVGALAGSRIERVVYVSCAPVTFARDAASLVEGGLDLRSVAVVDQFRYAAEIELVGVFVRQ
ncbi:MAG: hypothetical protein AAFX81_04550 [Pseudomonadota bacterium]